MPSTGRCPGLSLEQPQRVRDDDERCARVSENRQPAARVACRVTKSDHAAGVLSAQWPQVQAYSARLHSPQVCMSSLKRRFTGLASAVCLNCTTTL